MASLIFNWKHVEAESRILKQSAAQEWAFVDFSVPWDRTVVTKKDEKIIKYCALLWQRKS